MSNWSSSYEEPEKTAALSVSYSRNIKDISDDHSSENIHACYKKNKTRRMKMPNLQDEQGH